MTGQRSSEATRRPTAGRGAPRPGAWAVAAIALGLLLPVPLAAQTADDTPAVPHGAPQNADAPAVSDDATSSVPASRPAADREAEEHPSEDDYSDWAQGPAEIVGGPRGPMLARETETLDLAPAAGPEADTPYDEPAAVDGLKPPLGDQPIGDGPAATPADLGTTVPAARPDPVDREEEPPEGDDYSDWASGPATGPEIVDGLSNAVDLVPAEGPEAEDPAADDGLQAQLTTLADDEGFSLFGLARIGDEPARAAGAPDLEARLQLLLDGYNYFLLYDADGHMSAVHILGEQPPAPPPPNRFFVQTTRQGQHHLVDATLTGPTGVWLQRQMIIDTGASTVVLPTSLIELLGIDPATLSQGWAETAGGRVLAKSGRLAVVAVGKAEARDVAVIFISDEKLGDKALLGMSFLQNFEFTIDDFAQQVVLIGR